METHFSSSGSALLTGAMMHAGAEADRRILDTAKWHFEWGDNNNISSAQMNLMFIQLNHTLTHNDEHIRCRQGFM